MRNIGLVSAAVMAMVAMAGAVAASAPPVIQERILEPSSGSIVVQDGALETWHNDQESIVSELFFEGVRSAEEAGLSGEAAQQRIKESLETYIEQVTGPRWIIQGLRGRPLARATLAHTQRVLINRNQLRRGSDGDLAFSAMLAELGGDRSAGSSANRGGGGYGSGSSGGYGGGTRNGGGGPSTAGDAGRNVPGNEAAGQPATDAATTEVQQSQTTDDPDLDDEAGEPD